MDMLPLTLIAENGNSLQQLALLAWLRGGDEYKGFLESVVAGRVCLDIWDKLTGTDRTDAYRNEAILAIARYIKENPGASERDIQKVVKNEINAFREKIEKSETFSIK